MPFTQSMRHGFVYRLGGKVGIGAYAPRDEAVHHAIAEAGEKAGCEFTIG